MFGGQVCVSLRPLQHQAYRTSMNRAISHGQALRSIFGRSRVTHS